MWINVYIFFDGMKKEFNHFSNLLPTTDKGDHIDSIFVGEMETVGSKLYHYAYQLVTISSINLNGIQLPVYVHVIN